MLIKSDALPPIVVSTVRSLLLDWLLDTLHITSFLCFVTKPLTGMQSFHTGP